MQGLYGIPQTNLTVLYYQLVNRNNVVSEMLKASVYLTVVVQQWFSNLIQPILTMSRNQLMSQKLGRSSGFIANVAVAITYSLNI